MKERILWEKFRKSGKIADYLSYADCKNENKDYIKASLSKVK